MNTEPQIAVEPVTDEDLDDACTGIPSISREAAAFILLRDRRRVAERQAPEIERLRAEVAQADADYNDAVTLAQMNLDLLKAVEAEVAALKAACAQKDGVIIRFLNAPLAQRDGTPVPSLLLASARAALSDTAGKGWIDATGAVEAVAHRSRPANVRVVQNVPAEWAGSRVLIVRVP